VNRTTILRLATLVVARARRLLRATEGTSTIEYALLVALLTLVIVGALGDLGEALIALPLPALITALGG
jgi:Flp pilus assembly pilin Flp